MPQHPADFEDLTARVAERGERQRVIRSGERDEISGLVRQLVYKRDEWTCQFCGATPWANGRRSGPLHLDHITPWSAGGSDRSDNLRTLCGDCNLDRSNFLHRVDKPALPIVRACAFCLGYALAEWPDGAFDAYCACRHHVTKVLPGWHVM